MSSQPKVVLVTGCSQGGIGFALCEAYARRGCKVYATARRLEAMDALAAPNIEKLVLDVTDDDNVRSAVQTIIDREGRIDMVVNNAGSNCPGTIIDVPLDAVQRVFDANFFSVLRVVKAVFPHMATHKSGTIVNVGSITGEIPTPWSGYYATTKAALRHVSEVLWLECKPFNIDVVLVAAGGVVTKFSANSMTEFTMPEDSFYKAYTKQIIARIYASHARNSVSVEDFAAHVVSGTLASKPPLVIRYGGNTLLWKIFAWLPRTWVLRLLWQKLLRTPKDV